MYRMPQSKIVWPLFLKKFVVGSQFFNLTLALSFDHNSCISNLNKQCKNILNIYTSRSFQQYVGGPIWCLFTFPTKVVNILISTHVQLPKWVHLGVIGLHPLHSPPLWKCVSLNFQFLLLYPLQGWRIYRYFGHVYFAVNFFFKKE